MSLSFASATNWAIKKNVLCAVSAFLIKPAGFAPLPAAVKGFLTAPAAVLKTANAKLTGRKTAPGY